MRSALRWRSKGIEGKRLKYRRPDEAQKAMSIPEEMNINIHEEQVCFYFEIGLAITQWAHLERSILELLFSTSRRMNYNAVGHGYFSIENFRSKLAFANEYLQKSLKRKKHIKEWDSLHDDCESLSYMRNKLAHHRVHVFPAAEAGRRYVLVPWIAKKTRQKTTKPIPPSDALGLLAIVAHRHELFRTTRALDLLADRLKGRPARAFVRLDNQPTLRALAHQIHEALGHPRQPP